jgi:hypothetical protein
MKRRILLAILISLNSLAVQAQEWPFELWHDGKIVLVSGDTLKGLVKYDLQQDLVQFNAQRGNVVEVYTARKVLFFEIFDTTIDQYRNFFSLPYNATTGYRTPVLFELLAEGKMTLLSRENLEYRTYSSPYYFGSYSRQVLVYKFYLLEENGKINEFIGKKSELLQLMGRKAEEVENFIRQNKLKIEEREDFTKVVTYYNSLFKS